MKKISSCSAVWLICLLLNFHTSRAQNIVQLLKEKAGNIQQPFLVVNVPSNDCIMCRGSVLNLLQQIKYKEKTIVLFDDPVMQLFIDKYPENFKGYKLFFDKKISDSLTPDQISAAYIVTDTGIRKFIIKTITPQNIDLLNTALAATNTTHTTFTFNTKPAASNKNYSSITYFNGLGNGGFITDANSSLLFNDHVQVGLYHEAGKDPVFIEPQNLALTENRLLPIVLERYHLRLAPDTLKELALSTSAISPIVLMGMENDNDEISGVVRLNIVRNKSPEGDTNFTLGVTGYYFLGTGANSISATLSPTSYTKYYLLDTFHLDNQCYQATPTFGCYKVGNTAYFQVLEADANGAVKKPRKYHLAKTELKKDKTAPVLLKLYQMETYNKNPTENFLIAAGSIGDPIVAYKNTRTIFNYKGNTSISFSDLLGTGYDKAELNDIKLEGDKITSLFLQDDSLIVSTYNVKSRKKILQTTSLPSSYSGGKFVNNNIRIYRKDAVNSTYTFDDIEASTLKHIK